MVKVVGVRFKDAGKVYYFDPGELDIKEKDNVIIETSRGVEFGTVVTAIKEVSEDEVVSSIENGEAATISENKVGGINAGSRINLTV